VQTRRQRGEQQQQQQSRPIAAKTYAILLMLQHFIYSRVSLATRHHYF
jgi:hypothetical protein